MVWSQDVIRREKSDVGEPPEWDVCGSVVKVVVVIQVVFAFAQGRQWYTIDGFECRPTSRGLSALQQVVVYSQLAETEL